MSSSKYRTLSERADMDYCAEARRNPGADIYETYQAFMAGYVRRINESTLKVNIGGVRIGTAKYSRLAQINLQSRIITFSRFAVENVPERGRRYLVIHELAHVRESSHNRRFWGLVAQHEPDYKRIGKAIQKAFEHNVRKHNHFPSSNLEISQSPLILLGISGRELQIPDVANQDDLEDSGIICGGSEPDFA